MERKKKEMRDWKIFLIHNKHGPKRTNKSGSSSCSSSQNDKSGNLEIKRKILYKLDRKSDTYGYNRLVNQSYTSWFNISEKLWTHTGTTDASVKNILSTTNKQANKHGIKIFIINHLKHHGELVIVEVDHPQIRIL